MAASEDHLETRYAFRTRLLDCFWAGLPIATTSGDDLAARIERDDLGVSCRPGDAAGLRVAIEAILARGRFDFAPQLARVAGEFRWEAVCAPLRSFVLDPLVTPRLNGVQRALAPRPSQRARALVHQAARTASSLGRTRRRVP